ncbi:30S ribosomal protein S11 [Bacillus sp. NRRL B-14911]|nr:30S ribosomal protein S11 [Bacillus sp. NRRL B-14911]
MGYDTIFRYTETLFQLLCTNGNVYMGEFRQAEASRGFDVLKEGIF